MAQRYVPDGSHFPRDRSPPRQSDRYAPSGPSSGGAAAAAASSRAAFAPSAADQDRDAPRGPRAAWADPPPRPAATARGRAGFPRADYRPDYRDRDPAPRDRRPSPPPAWGSWRDRERSPPRTRAPVASDYRDFRDPPPRDPDFDRRRDPAFSSSQSYDTYRSPDPASAASARGRGRGRSDWSFRGRGRSSFFREDRRDERPLGGDSFRPGDRSPVRDRSWASRDERSFSRADDRFPDRRDDSRPPDRDDRSRDADRFARDPPPPIDTSYRPAPGNLGSASQYGPLSASRAAPGPDRDFPTARRASTFTPSTGPRDAWRDEPPSLSGKTQSSSDRPEPQPPSPPRAPVVPAFGSVPKAIPPAATKPAPNVWTASSVSPKLIKQQPPPPPPPSLPPKAAATTPTSDASPTLPPLPKPETSARPPAAPKAERGNVPALSTPVVAEPKQPSLLTSRSSETLKTPQAPSFPTTPSQQSTASFSKAPQTIASQAAPSGLVRSPPTGPRQQPPTGPRAQRQQIGAFTARPLPDPSTSPNLAPQPVPRPPAFAQSPQLSSAIPTGPRANRVLPPQAQARPPPGPLAGSPPSWAQWNRRGSMSYGQAPSVVPAKRDANGEQTTKQSFSTGRSISTAKDDSPINAPSEPRSMRDTHMSNHDQPFGQHSLKVEKMPSPSQTQREVDEMEVDQPLPESKELGHGYGAHQQDEDLMDLDEADFADNIAGNEEKFEREKAALLASKHDLSADYWRALTPLRNIAMLSRLSLLESSTFFLPAKASSSRDAATDDLTNGQEDILTPKASEESEEPKELVRPVFRRPTPPPKTPPPVTEEEIAALPFLIQRPLTPVSDNEYKQEQVAEHEASRELMLGELEQLQLMDDEVEEQLQHEYEELYRIWRKSVAMLDAEHEREEREEKASTLEPIATPVLPEVSPTTVAAVEGRGGRSRGISEYDMQRVLELSRESAAQEAAKREKEALSAKPDYSREAVIPDMIPESELDLHTFDDTSLLRDSHLAVFYFNFLPPEDDFTEEEHHTMVQNFRDYPKKFGKLAQALPGRNYKDCINHYYATKWKKEFKPPKDKRKVRKAGPRKGGAGRPRASALISNLGGDAQPDLYGGDEANGPISIPVNDNGRPRRAAAPTFGDNVSMDPSTAASTPARKPRGSGIAGDGNGERIARKPRGTVGAKERTQRRTKPPTSQRVASMSPEKLDTDVALGANMVTGELISDRRPGSHQLSVANASMVPGAQNHEAIAQDLFIAHSNSLSGAGSSKNGPSSYWSVAEVSNFPQYLSHFGTDWQGISNYMGTKSATMVKNYYTRLMNSENKDDIRQLAEQGDEKRHRGEEIGVPPTPSMSHKKRNESVQPTIPRPMSSTAQSEAIEIDDSTPPPQVRSAKWTIPKPTKQPVPNISVRDTIPPRVVSLDGPSTNAPSQTYEYGPPRSQMQPQSISSDPFRRAEPPFRREEQRIESTNIHNSIGYLNQSRPRVRNPDFPFEQRPPPAKSSPEGPWQPHQLPEALRHDRSTVPPPLGQRSYYGGSPKKQDIIPPGPASLHHGSPDFEARPKYDRPEPMDLRNMSGPPPSSRSFFDPLRAVHDPVIPRDEYRAPPPTTTSTPPQPPVAPTRPEPRRSNISALLNADPPPAPKPAPKPSVPAVNEPRTYTPSQASPFAPPSRPLSQPERPEPFGGPPRSSSGTFAAPGQSVRQPSRGLQYDFGVSEAPRASTARPETSLRYAPIQHPEAMRSANPFERPKEMASSYASPTVPRFPPGPLHGREASGPHTPYGYHQPHYGPPERTQTPGSAALLYAAPHLSGRGPPPNQSNTQAHSANSGLPSFLQPGAGSAEREREREGRAIYHDERDRYRHGPEPEVESSNIGMGLHYRRASDASGAFRRE